jgi:hypothetical protein
LVEPPPTGRDHTDLFAALWTFDTVDGQVTDDHPGGCHVAMWIHGGGDRFRDYELESGPKPPMRYVLSSAIPDDLTRLRSARCWLGRTVVDGHVGAAACSRSHRRAMRGSVVKIQTVPAGAGTGAVYAALANARSVCAKRDKPAGVVTDLAQPMMKINRRERELAARR